MAEKLGYADFLADLESKRAALDSLITSFRAALSLGALGQPGEGIDVSGLLPSVTSGGANGGEVELPRGALLGRSLPAAIKLYLSAVKRKQTIREIATALKAGGVESTSDNFENIVTGSLHRMRRAGDVLRFKDGWGLTEFYPETLRQRMQETKPKAKKPSTKPAKMVKPKKGARGANVTPKKSGSTIDSRILEVLSDGVPVTPKALAFRLEAPSNVVGLALGRLTFKSRVQKHQDGRYSLSEAQPALRAVSNASFSPIAPEQP